ncbi:hypothetical protein LP417_02635 [Polaromonas sp. P1-6]|nr:hypothetical protein LP417_02635 [Polaromonas sp. P1-6]
MKCRTRSTTRFCDNPLVTGDPNIRFYAGAPLVTPDGLAIGTLCVIDRTPRQLTPEQRGALAVLGRQLVRQFELRLAARRVQERTAQLEAANRELESFSYSVSHDLRAPLRHIDGYLEMLLEGTRGQLVEQSQRYLKMIAQASRQMNQLIDDLLAFSRMNHADMREAPVDLGVLVRETIDSLKMDTEGRHIAWQVASLPRVVGDTAMLRQVLANLLGNAVKYTGPREAAQIEIGSAGEENGRVVLFVRDNGVGFDMQHADKLFGVFQRLHRADEFEGTGIGLASVRRIIERHGGRVWAEGKTGAGATFYFTLKRSAPGQTPMKGASSHVPREVGS